MARGDNNQVVYVAGDVPQLPLQLGQLLVDSSQVSPGNTNLQQCTSQSPLTYEPLQGGYPESPAEVSVGVVIVNYRREPADVERYGTNTTPGTTDMTAALATASSVSAAGGGDIIVRSVIRVTANTTLPVGVTLRFTQGGQITVDSGDTLTIRGKIVAPRAHIFAGAGTVVFGAYTNNRDAVAFPEWFGAAGDNSTDCTAEIQTALNMVAPAYGAVSLSTGYYLVSATLTIPTRLRIYGVNWIESVIIFVPDVLNSNDSLFQDDAGGTDNCEFDHFALVASGAATGKRGFTISSSASAYLWHNMSFTGFNDWCITIDSCQQGYIENCRFGNTHNGTNTGTAVLTSTFANRFSVNKNRFFNNDRDVTVNDSGTSVSICENAMESTGSLASAFSQSVTLVNVSGFAVDLNYVEGVRTSTTTGAFRFEACTNGSVDRNYMNGEDLGPTYTDSFVQFTGNSRGCRANNNKFVNLGITSGLQQFIIAGNYVIEAHGNHYEDGGTQLTTYQDVVARLGNPANIDVDFPYTFTYDPNNLVDGTGETSASQTLTGATFGDSISVAAPYSLQGILATAYVSAADTCVVRLQNETGGDINLASGTWKLYRKAGNL